MVDSLTVMFCWEQLQKGPSVADTVIGEGNTTEWKMCGLDKSTCLTVFFDLSSSDQSSKPGGVNSQLYIQFMTRYPFHAILGLCMFTKVIEI